MKPAAQARNLAPQPESPIAGDVLAGMLAHPKRLPAYLFYDAEGSRLFELITALPEYYLTRTERGILTRNAGDIAAMVAPVPRGGLTVVELGAGTATKSQVLLRAVVSRQARCSYLPVDCSRTALDLGCERLSREEPGVSLRPLTMRNEASFDVIRRVKGSKLALFIGSSIGNYEEVEAVALLRGIRVSVGPHGWLLLGADWRKSPDVMVPAYDDAEGVTAAFNKNMLVHINRELGARFAPDRFRHVALWNDRMSRIEMHLESTVDQLVPIEAIGLEVAFRRGERIHTESSRKFDPAGIDSLLRRAGFEPVRTFEDDDRLFGVHLARAVPLSSEFRHLAL